MNQAVNLSNSIKQYIHREKKELFITVICCLICSIFPSFFTKNADMYPLIVLCPLSSICFFTFIHFSKTFNIEDKTLKTAFACSYGLTGYLCVGPDSFSAKLVYTLLPVLFLCFEAFLNDVSSIPLILCSSILLCTNAPLACFVFIVLFLYYCLFNQHKLGLIVSNLIHYMIIIVLAFFITAPLSLLQLEDYFSAYSKYQYEFTSLTYPIGTFFSRIFSFSVSSFVFSSNNGIDLGIGVCLFAAVILFFFNKNASAKIKFKTFIFLFILLAVAETTPFLFCANLLTVNTNTISQVSVLIFALFCVAAKQFESSKNSSKKSIFIGIGVSVLSYVSIILFTAHHFSKFAIILHVVLLAIIGFLSCVHVSDSKKTTIFAISMVSELVLSTVLLSLSILVPKSPYLSDSFAIHFSKSSEAGTGDTLSDWPYTKGGNDYLSNHIALDLYNPLTQLDNNVDLTNDEITSFNPYGIVSYMDSINLKAKKIGLSNGLFEEASNVKISFPDEYSNLYTVTDMGNNIFNIETYPEANNYETDIFIPFDYEIEGISNDAIYIYDNFTTFIIACDSEDYNESTNSFCGRSYIRMSQTGHFSLNIEIDAYKLNQDNFANIANALRSYLASHQSTFSSIKYLIYFFMMIVGLCILLFFSINKDKTQYIQKLIDAKEKLANHAIFENISKSYASNKVYIWSFLIPFIMYISSMIVYSCAPFGSYSFLDCDGVSSVLGNFLNNFNSYKNGNFFVSTLGGYTNEITTTLSFLYYLLFIPFSTNQLPAVFIFTEAILVGLCGFTIVFYLVHRRTRFSASKRDFRLLFAAIIYSTNGYMLAMHSYIFWWYILFALFPIVVLALERLIYENKWFLFVLTLSICITTNFNIAFYICIYCAIHFFLCKFENLLDFIKKGIRFAICAIASALCGLSGWAYVFSSLGDSGYADSDSVIPHIGFLGSFIQQWSKFMIFSPTGAISHDNSDINIYMGVLTLIIFALFMFCKRGFHKKRLFYIIPAAFLLLSYNGNVLSYVWNGFHYQSGVPNRFVFIWMFLCGCIAYEVSHSIRHIDRLRTLVSIISIILLVTACFIFGDNIEKYRYIATMILLAIYGLILMTKSTNFVRTNFYRLLIIALCIEMFANMLFVCKTYCLDNLWTFGDMDQKTKTNESIVASEDSFSRFSFANYYGMNFGMFYDAPTNQIFISTLTSHTINTNFFYGYLCGSNYITSNYNSTPFGVSSSNTGYVVIPQYATVTQRDMKYYDYIGYANGDYYYKNNNALELGYRLPEDFIFGMYEVGVIPYEAYNYTACTLTNDYSTELFSLIPIEYDKTSQAIENSFSFTDKNGNSVSYDEAKAITQSEEAQAAGTLCCQDLYLTVNITAPRDGDLYIYVDEFISLGYAKKGEIVSLTFKYPSMGFYDSKEMYCYSMDSAFYEKYIDAAKQNMMTNVNIKDNVITGTTNYQESGYTLFSIPYSDNWHAYIDGKEVNTLDPMKSNLAINTPAGRHEIKLVYDTSRQIAIIVISILSYIICIAVCFIQVIFNHKKERRSKQ